MSNEIGSAHNHLFQNILGREDMARDFVRYYMPPEIVGDLDLDTLEVASESYISRDKACLVSTQREPFRYRTQPLTSDL